MNDTWVELSDADPDNVGYFAEDYDRTHCIHGVFVGYAGGPDYMCHYCEMGMNRWVEAPLYQLHLTVLWDDRTLVDDHETNVQWRADGLWEHAWERTLEMAQEFQEIADEYPNGHVVYSVQFKAVETGYWSE